MIFLEGFEWSTSENILFIGEHVPPLYQGSRDEALEAATDLLTIICHPRPSMTRTYWTVDMIAALRPAPRAMEVYNAHYSRSHMVYRDPNPLYNDTWDALLTRGMRLWGFANDDSHDPQDFGCAFTMACVDGPGPQALLHALKSGRFYASTGPEMPACSVSDGRIRVELSADARGRFVGPHGAVLSETDGRDFSFTAGDQAYVRFEAEGLEGRIFLQPFYRAE